MAQICSRCGCSSFHYNRSRMRMECDLCGAPLRDPQQDQQLMQYDRTYSQAVGHLTAGNWTQAINLLKPLLEQYPTEKRLYLAVLRAATRDFSDLAMENLSARILASQAWDKLVRLNGVTGEMLRYSRRRYERHREELSRRRDRILLWIFMAALCSFLAGIALAIACYWIALAGAAGLAACLYQAYNLQPIRVIRQLMRSTPDDRSNPFV